MGKIIYFFTFFTAASLACCHADEINWEQASVETLIEQLATVDAQGPGLHGTATVGGFIGADLPLRFEGGVMGSQRPAVHPAMRELVRRGTAAMPLLVAHIDDATPTKLVVGGKREGEFPFMFQVFRNGYDPNPIDFPEQNPGESDSDYKFRLSIIHYEYVSKNERSFSEPYTVKVGDVCFALIGQILGRNYAAIGYQPTAGLVVNSPIETPELAEWIRRDWQDFSRAKHLELLLKDARANADFMPRARPSLERLKFYFPDVYERRKQNSVVLKKVIEEYENDVRAYENKMKEREKQRMELENQ